MLIRADRITFRPTLVAAKAGGKEASAVASCQSVHRPALFGQQIIERDTALVRVAFHFFTHCLDCLVSFFVRQTECSGAVSAANTGEFIGVGCRDNCGDACILPGFRTGESHFAVS